MCTHNCSTVLLLAALPSGAMSVCVDCAGFPEASPAHAACRVAPAALVSAALRSYIRRTISSASATVAPPHFEYSPTLLIPHVSADEPVALAELRALITTRNAALETVRANAAGAREMIAALLADRLTGLRVDHEGVEAKEAASTMLADVDRAEAAKVAALDSSLVDADAVLEKLEAEYAEVRDALACAEAGALSDMALIKACAQDLMPRVTAALGRVAALPRPFELTDTTLCVVPSPAPALGTVVITGIAVSDVRIGGLTRVMRRVDAGGALTFCVVYTAEARARQGFDAVIAIPSLVGAIAVDAVVISRHTMSHAPSPPPRAPPPAKGWACGVCSLLNATGSAECMACGSAAPSARSPSESPPSAVLTFQAVPGARAPLVAITPFPERAGALVTVTLPSPPGPTDLCIVIKEVTVAGAPLTSATAVLPAAAISDGLVPPLVLPGLAGVGWQVPCISTTGTLFVPRGQYVIEHAVDARRTRKVLAYGLPGEAFTSSFDDITGTLILASNNDRRITTPGGGSTVAALDASRLDDGPAAVRWRFQDINGCSGMALLPRHGAVVCGSAYDNRLIVLRISDGTELSAAPAGQVREIAAISDSGIVYASVCRNEEHVVHSFSWDGARLVDEGQVAEAGVGCDTRPMAALRSPSAASVAPGASIANVWHLVVGKFGSPAVCVLALPDHRVIWEGEMPAAAAADRELGPASGSGIWGLAADPCGASIVVCRANGRVEVLAWPWPGVDLRRPAAPVEVLVEEGAVMAFP